MIMWQSVRYIYGLSILSHLSTYKAFSFPFRVGEYIGENDWFIDVLKLLIFQIQTFEREEEIRYNLFSSILYRFAWHLVRKEHTHSLI